MPELPDLYIFSRNLHKLLAGRVVRNVAVWRTRWRNFTNQKIAETLQGRRLDEVRREGKEVHFRFSHRHCLAAHLMLAGRFDLVADPAVINFCRLGLEFEEGLWLVVSDPHGWATFTLDPKPAAAPDALAPECDPAYLGDRLRRNAALSLKAFLIDQRILRGIGNAYADEILWACRIAPHSLCGGLPEGKVAALHKAIREVLMEAIGEIERAAPDAINGEIRDFLKIHHPERTHSPSGRPIRCAMIAERKTYYCDEQVVYD